MGEGLPGLTVGLPVPGECVTVSVGVVVTLMVGVSVGGVGVREVGVQEKVSVPKTVWLAVVVDECVGLYVAVAVQEGERERVTVGEPVPARDGDSVSVPEADPVGV